jgi:hypothetical protein
VDKSKRQHFGTRRKLLTALLTTKHWHLIWNLQSKKNSSFSLLFTAISASLFQTVSWKKGQSSVEKEQRPWHSHSFLGGLAPCICILFFTN